MDFCFNRVWKLPFTYLSTSPRFQLDHSAVITYFTKSLFIGDLPLHRIKQKQAWRSFFDVKHTSKEQWSDYTNSIDDLISDNDSSFPFATKSSLPYEKKLLNRKWAVFRSALQTAADKHLPVKKVSNKIFEQECSNPVLIKTKTQLRSLNNIFAFLSSFCFYPNSFASHKYAQHMWFKDSSPCLYNSLTTVNRNHKNLIDPASIPSILPSFGHTTIKDLYKHVAALRNTLRQLRDALESSDTKQRIEHFESLRCTNFASFKSSFIASALSRSKRCIVLDRAMHTDTHGNTSLITDAAELKEITAAHFKNIAGAPPTVQMNFDLIQ